MTFQPYARALHRESLTSRRYHPCKSGRRRRDRDLQQLRAFRPFRCVVLLPPPVTRSPMSSMRRQAIDARP